MLEEQTFGAWLRRKRKGLDLTRERLADHVGCSAATIRKIEAEERRPSAQIAERLAEIFEIPTSEWTDFLRFARGDWKSATSEGKKSPPWSTSTHPIRSNLPSPLTSLVGRVLEIADVRRYLSNQDIRLVTLIGPPGIGKTRLSIEAAHVSSPDFHDGAFFVALAPLDDRKLIASAIAQALGYIGAKNISTIEQLKEGIADKDLLLVLDNCEHLIEDVSVLASTLLLACPHLKILATTRESLRIPGEWLYPVPILDSPEEHTEIDVESASKFPALTLFVERARAVRPDFDLNAENIKTVTSICARLDGLPLVIELIAARMRLMSPQALLDRLTGQFVLTADGMRAASERQKTLHNAIHWSYTLLSPEEQRLFVYLSVFSGSFTLDALETMFSQKSIEKPLPNLIALLLDKSLLKLAPDFEQSSETRYTMLVTIQEYARERLRELGEESEIRNGHLAYFLDFAEQADKELRGHSQIEWLNRLYSDRDNLRAALNWAIETKQTEIAMQMACKLHWFWFVRGDHSEGSQWLRHTLNMPDITLYPEAQAQALTQLAHHTWLQSGAKQARPLVEQALSVAQEHGHKWNTAKALAILGLVLIFEHNFDEAESTLEKSKGLFQEVGDKWGYAHSVMGLALGLSMQDDRAPSLVLHEQALLLFRGLGDRYFQSAALRHIGKLQVSQDDLTGGITALREAMLLAQDLNSKFEIYAVIWYFAEAAQRAGRFRHALPLFWAAKNIAASIGAWLKEDEIEFQNNLEACRTALEDAEYEEVVETGRAMTMEQAIAYALQGSD